MSVESVSMTHHPGQAGASCAGFNRQQHKENVKMNPHANKQFVAELHQRETPEKFTRAVVHGRVFSSTHGEWFVVITDMIPAPENGLMESYYHGYTRLVASTEYLMWGGELVKVHMLPIVNHEGVRVDSPGVVSTGIKSERGKVHMLYYEFAHVSEWTGCGRDAELAGAMDASLYMGGSDSCRDCQRQLLKIVNEL